MKTTVRLAGMSRESTVDGPGVRLTIFFQGCPHHCKGCHNPDTWDSNGGEELTIQETLDLLARYITPLHQGITFSGGEPFLQAEALLKLVKGIRERFPQLNIWCYSGYQYEDLLCSPVLPLLDVLVDGPFEEANRELDLIFRGSSNQRIIDLALSEESGQVVEHPAYK
ncbi:MAG: anaerobic ribonucleoside-triphosphate reductase activating protein [Methylocystaceae bacterium]